MEIETLKLIASFLTPLTIAFVGYLIQRILAQQAKQEKLRARLVDKRLEIFEKVAEDLNRIYCYIRDVGDFYDENPDTIIAAKRRVDRLMFIYEAIWPVETFNSYNAFMDSSFDHFQGGFGKSAKIRAKTIEKKKAYELIGKWPTDWDERFSTPDSDHPNKYQMFKKLLSKDLDIVDSPKKGKE